MTNWGILATGKIAHSFARDLALVPDAKLVAAGSRSLASATAFTDQYAGTPHGSYAELVADPDVEIVYVASPHGLHVEHVNLALDAGKHVLCEKAITLRTSDAEELFAKARSKGLFLMEAMWMATHPLIRELRDRFDAGEFGTPRQLVADLGFVVDRPVTDRVFDPALGGGALLDMGIYPLTLAQLFLGSPSTLTGAAVLSDLGVDLNISMSAAYASGAAAAMTSTLTANSPRHATISTDRGRLEFSRPFHNPAYVDWIPMEKGEIDGVAGEPVRITPAAPVIGEGYGNEIVEVQRCLAAGELESPLVPAEQTLAIMRQMDDVRAQVGVRYPGE